MDSNQTIAIVVISVIGLIFIFVYIMLENKIANSVDKNNERIIYQYSELMEYEKRNNLKNSPPPTVKITKRGYISFLPSQEQINHFNQN